MLRRLKNSDGFLTIGALLLSATLSVGALVYMGGTIMEKLIDRISRNFDRAMARYSKEEDWAAVERDREDIGTFRRLIGPTAAIVNGATPIGAIGGRLRDALPVVEQFVIDRAIDRGLQDPPTSSNTRPPDVAPPPACTSSSLNGCVRQSDCQAAGGTWQSSNQCSTRPQPQCRRNNLAGCTSPTDCERVGGYWYNSACNASPQCNGSRLDLCTTPTDCTTHGGYWYDDHCNYSPEECYVDATKCRRAMDCEAAGGYWYDQSCHLQSKCADGGGVCICANDEEICCAQVCDGITQCSDGSDEWTCDCDETGIFLCANGKVICANRVCNNRDDCGDGSDEDGCQSQDSCCVQTQGCPAETATSCAETCCCCPLGQVCDRDNWWNGCVPGGF